jgi:hypothetical protein
MGWRASAGTSSPAPRGLPDRAAPVKVCVLTTVRLSEEVALPGKYEGVHAFLFLYQEDETPPAAVIENLRLSINRDAGPVFFAGTFEGDFQGFAHIADDNTQAVGDLIAGRLWEAGVRSHYVTEAKYHKNQQGQAMGPTRYSPRFLAIARVYVSQPPTQVMENVARSFGDRLDQYGESLSAFIGASTVIGGFHLLVELGDDDRQELDRHVESLRGVDGVGRVEVAVTDMGPTQAA